MLMSQFSLHQRHFCLFNIQAVLVKDSRVRVSLQRPISLTLCDACCRPAICTIHTFCCNVFSALLVLEMIQCIILRSPYSLSATYAVTLTNALSTKD